MRDDDFEDADGFDEGDDAEDTRDAVDIGPPLLGCMFWALAFAFLYPVAVVAGHVAAMFLVRWARGHMP